MEYIGLKSGEYGGKNSNLQPADSINSRVLSDLWKRALSMMTVIPAVSVGSKVCSNQRHKYRWNLSQFRQHKHALHGLFAQVFTKILHALFHRVRGNRRSFFMRNAKFSELATERKNTHIIVPFLR